MRDTGIKGGMYKDGVYLRGAIDILKNRKKIDFKAFYSGKVSLRDFWFLEKQKLIDKSKVVLPYFMQDME